MEASNPHIDDLIVQLFTEDITPEGEAELRQWIVGDPSHERYFRAQVDVWTSSFASRDARLRFDKDSAYRKFLDYIARHGYNVRHTPTLIRRLLRYAAVAAIVVCAMVGGYRYGVRHETSRYADITVKAPLGSYTVTTLPDGTLVSLNAGSTLVYSQGFGIADRQVRLTGEAYFEVTKNANLPFSVNSHDIKVSVLGTKFNFRDYPEDGRAEVVLREGSVRLGSLVHQGIECMLEPGQRAVYDKRQGTLAVNAYSSETATAWARGEMVIDGQNLSEIAVLLERNYDVKVELKNSALNRYHFYGTFTPKTQPLSEVLQKLSTIRPFRYTLTDSTLTLY